MSAVAPASVALQRLMAHGSVGLRGASALAAGTAALVGLAPPASPGLVVMAVIGLIGWTATYAAVMLRRGWTRWLVVGDIGVAAVLNIGHGWLAPAGAVASGSSWVFVVASATAIGSLVSPWPLLRVVAAVALPGTYEAGLLLAGHGRGVPVFPVTLAVMATVIGSLWVMLSRCGRAIDEMIVQHESVQRDAAVKAARRAEEREHCRLLHDSVSATLTVVAAGGVAGSPVLRVQACRDLGVIERLRSPVGAPATRPVPVSVDGIGPADGTGQANARSAPGQPDRGGLRRWLAPVAAATRPGLVVDTAIDEIPVPDPVGAAFAGAVAEALTNVARHAGASRVSLRAESVPGGVRVELADDGHGFDLARVPPQRRGIRESVVARMSEVGGSAVVVSRPAEGTRIVLHWPASGTDPGRERGDSAPGPTGLGELVVARYRHGFGVAIVCIVAVRHLGNDLLRLIRYASVYRPLSVEVAAWLLMSAIGAAGAVRLLRGQHRPAVSWLLAGGTLVVAALATAAVPSSAVLTSAHWAAGATGWFGVLVLLRRPTAQVAALIAANAGFTLAVLVHDGVADRVGLARFLIVMSATAAPQLALALVIRALDGTSRRAALVAEQEAAVRRQTQVAEQLHLGRLDRYETVRRSAEPLLAGLASGELDPADRGTQRRCAVEASRLRRLFAETDDRPDPLLHELEACADIAAYRGVLVDVQVAGHLPPLDRPVRRALTEAPLHALAGAERQARITVVSRSREVAVSVLADARVGERADLAAPGDPTVTVTTQDGDGWNWIEARWRRG